MAVLGAMVPSAVLVAVATPAAADGGSSSGSWAFDPPPSGNVDTAYFVTGTVSPTTVTEPTQVTFTTTGIATASMIDYGGDCLPNEWTWSIESTSWVLYPTVPDPSSPYSNSPWVAVASAATWTDTFKAGACSSIETDEITGTLSIDPAFITPGCYALGAPLVTVAPPGYNGGTFATISIGGADCSAFADTDGDGILDVDDQCPTVPGDHPTGCPQDTDGDGIRDTVDQCPTVPGDAPTGCPDQDGDGIPDASDQCPTVPGDPPTGCPDRDGDGVPDAVDNCPDVSNANQIDTDLDGVGDACDGNRPPVAIDDAITVPMNQAGPIPTAHLVDWTAGPDYDPDFDQISLVAASQPFHGTTETHGDFLWYTPNADYSGPDSFSYTITDTHGAHATGTVRVTVEQGGCDVAYTTGTAHAEAFPAGDLSLSMGVRWCHDGVTASLLDGQESIALVTGQTGLDLNPLFLAMNGLFDLQIEQNPIDTYAITTPQPDGSLVVDGRTEFRATVDGLQVALALLPGFGIEGRTLKHLQQAFFKMPASARSAFIARITRQVVEALEKTGVQTLFGPNAFNELPKLAEGLANVIQDIITTAGCAVGCNHIRLGISTWTPSFQFHLLPDGTAVPSLTGEHGLVWFTTVEDFHNYP